MLEKVKVPLEKKESVRDKINERERKQEVEPELPLKKTLSSSPRPSPEKELVSSSPTPSTETPVRSRNGSADSRTSSKRDSADLQVIKLPSVKQLAQQFNVCFYA